MDDPQSLRQSLETARRMLAFLEQQAAGYTSLTIPAHLQIELEDKRREVASLESRLAQAEGRPAARPPDNLLSRPPVFVGREREIARCLEALDPDERGWGVVIDGLGGMGKTALALEVAHRARERAWFDAYLFVSAKTTWLTPQGVREETLAFTSLDAFTREFARLLGERAVAEMSEAGERAAALLNALRGRRTLLIWDNLETLTAEERERIAAFQRKLPAPNKAILTSRRRTGESALTVRLGKLSEAEAFQLMEALAHRRPRLKRELERAGEALRRALYDAAGGNPLALHWSLGLVAEKGYTLRDALARLQDAARSGDLYRFLFAAAARGLPENDRAVLSALAAFQTPARPPALAEALGKAQTEVESALERLTALSLVDEWGEGGYGLHPLTRAFVNAALRQERGLEDLSLSPQARRAALRRWVDYAKKYGGDHKDAYRTFGRLEEAWPDLETAAAALREMSGLPAALQDEEAARMLGELASALRTFLWFRGYWDERIRLAEWAYRAAEAREAWREAGWRAYDAAWIYYHRGETEPAQAWAGRMAQAMERGGTRPGLAESVRLQGLLAQQRGDLAEAERLYREALRAYRALEDEASEATLLNNLGEMARLRGDYRQAEASYRRALEIAEKRGNKEQQANFSGNLGLLALDEGRPEEARPWFEQSLALAREVGRQDLIAFAQHNLARVLEEAGRYAEALPLAEEALRFREQKRDRNLENTRQLVARLREKARGA